MLVELRKVCLFVTEITLTEVCPVQFKGTYGTIHITSQPPKRQKITKSTLSWNFASGILFRSTSEYIQIQDKVVLLEAVS